MRKKWVNTISVLTVLVGVLVFIYWIEAEKELKVLCSMIEAGDSVSEVEDLLKTGDLLSYQNKEERLLVNSNYNFQVSECEVKLQWQIAKENGIYTEHFLLEQSASIWGAVLTGLLILFQAALAFGYPLGEFAWGGFHKKIPSSLQKASAISSVLLILPVCALLSIAGIDLMPTKLSVRIVLAFNFLFLLSIIGNLASDSTKERAVMIPFSMLLFLSYFIVSYSNI